MPDSVTIQREVVLRAIVTENLKEELDDEFAEAIDQIDQRITQLDVGARQYVTELQRTDMQQAMQVRQQIEAEKRRYRQAKDQLIQRQRQVEELEEGTEIIRGTTCRPRCAASRSSSRTTRSSRSARPRAVSAWKQARR
jgi:hypothetical protein